MATFTITTAQNIDALTSKAGGDTYNVNGGTLTIDQDSRVGTNQTTSTTLGPMTLSASLGGTINIDGTDIWLIPYTGGSGNVPAWNTAITDGGSGGGTGKLIGVHSALTAASTATGAAMPASGYIRVKQKSGIYTANALGGITATASDAGRVGWIEIVGDEASTINANRLGQFNITGEWYEIGTTSGSSNQTMQIPNNGLLRYAAGVYIQKYAGPRVDDFTGGSASIQVTDAGNQALASWEVYPLQLNVDASNSIQFVISGDVVYAKKKIAGSTSTVGSSIAYNSTTMKYFRIRESAGVTYWDYSIDGTTWINLASAANPLAVTAMYPQIFAGTYSAEGSTTVASFDDFVLTTVTAQRSYSDAFTDNSLNTLLWSNWGGVQVSEASTELQVTSTTGAAYYGIESAIEYEFYPNAGIVTTTGTEAARGKCVWIDNTGLVRIGNSGAATNGYTPASGLKVVIGNVFLENCTTAARTANVIPNATIATRYDFTTTGGGVLSIERCNMAWYLSCTQAYSVNVSHAGFVDAILLSEVATAMTFTNMGVGNKPTTALVVAPLTMTLCLAGGVFTDCRFQRVATGANNSTQVVLTDCDGFTFTRMQTRYAALRAHTLPVSITATRVANTTFDELRMIDGQFSLVTCANVTINNTIYIGQVSGTTGTGQPCTAFLLTSNCLNVTIDGLTLPVTNTHPYTGLFSIGVAGCANTKIRNIGTYASPLSLGSANATGIVLTLTASAAAINTRMQRVYCSNTRTGLITGDNSSKGLILENVFGDYADAADVSAVINMSQRGLGGTKALTAQTSVYGTHFIDYFTSTTAGRLGIVMNEPTAETTSQVTLANGAAFTSAGGLYMPVIGHSAIFETPDYIIGHTGFANSAAIMGGGTAGNYTYEYSIDKNDGNGYSAMTSSSYSATTLATALNGLTGISAVTGFKLKIKITTGTTNATAITSLYILTTSTTTTQAYQYPLEVVTVAVTAQDAADFSAIQNARVIIEADAGGPLPALESVTITRSGSVASVAHTAHGMSAGKTVVIRGAAQDEYNGRFSITNVTTNAYDYTVSGTPTTPATGTITATAQILTGLTDADGLLATTTFEYSSDQPVVGKVRKASGSPNYKEGTVVGTITSTGFSNTVLLVGDE